MQRKDRHVSGALGQDRVTGGHPAMPRQCDPRRNGGARQGGGFLEGEMARYVNEGLLAQNCVFCEHPVEIGSEPIGAVIGLDRPTEPPRVEATGQFGRQS